MTEPEMAVSADPGSQGEARPGEGWIWLDGELRPGGLPHLPVTDRGFQLGDGVFETLRARRGVVIELEEHLARLHDSAHVMAINLPDDALLTGAIRRLVAAAGLDGRGDGGSNPGDAALRITATRGALARPGLLPSGWGSAAPTVAIQIWPYAPSPAWALDRGLSVVESRSRRDPTSPLAGVKSTSRAELVHARIEAERAGADDAVFLTIDGRLSEATTANLFLIRGDSLVTPALSAAVLAGTTRTWLIEEGRAGRLPGDRGVPANVEERDLWPADLLGADEAFLSSSVAGILPLTRYKGRPIGSGLPGARTLALRALRERWIDAISLAGDAISHAGVVEAAEAAPAPREP